MYSVRQVSEHTKTYFYIVETSEEGTYICKFPSKYLVHKTRAKASPNTVRRNAFSLAYYLDFCLENEVTFSDIYHMPYDKQTEWFVSFLNWLKGQNHIQRETKKEISNNTCNTYLEDVFGFYQFLTLHDAQFDSLKVLIPRSTTVVNSIGVKKHVITHTFRGYLPKERHKGKSIKKDNIIILLKACTNVRNQLLLLLLAETGFRIGELLGIRYSEDIDFEKHTLRVYFREGNENAARAKYAEYREAKISDETFDVLMFYLATYRDVLKDTDYLFVNLSGENYGKALKSNAVYAILNELEKKTGVKVTPHMLRHYFADERRKNGWDILLISEALGHKNIETTRGYLNIENDELISANEAFYKKNGSLYMADQLL